MDHQRVDKKNQLSEQERDPCDAEELHNCPIQYL